MEWVTMGFINIPKRFLKIHKTSNAFNLCAVPLYIIAYYNYVNMSKRNMRLLLKVWLKNNPKRQKLFQERKGPLRSLLKPWTSRLFTEGMFSKCSEGGTSFIMRPWDSSSTRASFYSSAGTAPIPKECSAFTHYFRITVIQNLLSFCLGLWVSQKHLCSQ